MNCGKCPHLREIEAAHEKCHRCDRAAKRELTFCDGCENLKRIEAALKPCATCDAGKIHGQVSIDAAADQNLVLNYRDRLADLRRKATEAGCSQLPIEAEEAVRIMLMSIFDLDPLELLLIQHLVRGGSYASFNRPIKSLVERITRRGYNLDDGQTGFRAIVSIWATRIMEKIPTIHEFFNAAKWENRTNRRTFGA